MDFPNKRMRQTDEKVQLNLFLGEYLKFCLLTGPPNIPSLKIKKLACWGVEPMQKDKIFFRPSAALTKHD